MLASFVKRLILFNTEKRHWLARNFVLDFVLAFAKRAKSAGYAKSPFNGFSRIYGSSVTYKTVALFESYLRSHSFHLPFHWFTRLSLIELA